MEDQVHQFIHKHPLKLIEDCDDRSIDVFGCWLCREHISLSNGSSGSSVYVCTYSCLGFLHKTCGQLKKSFHHSLHPFHPLSIKSHSIRLPSLPCNVCDREIKYGKCYHCEICKFIACMKCVIAEVAQNAAAAALKEESASKFIHKGHNPQHTLTLQLRPAAFYCNACKTEKKDFFYQCDHCDFWIHKTCTFLTPTINLPHYHHHPLSLVFSLPEKFYKYTYRCELCNKTIMQTDWTYHCSNCRCFIHIKCVPNPDQLPSTQRVAEEDSDILHFPMSHAFTDPLKLLHSENDTTAIAGGGDDERSVEINHWSHDHPLFLTVEPQGKNFMPDIGGSDPIITVCHCCVRPLSYPYYSCKHDGCSFTLHKYCVELSRTLQHQLHPDHPLELINQQSSVCHFCFKICNAFMYKCITCSIHIDVNCAFLPKIIKHEFHKQHHLVQHIGLRNQYCTICERPYYHFGYSCDACNFQLDLHCALESPRSLPHRYCKGHEIPLLCPPIEDHPEDFYCEICEKEMHPKLPLYHCGKCKNSFHPSCLSRWYYYQNYLLEGTNLSVPGHKHPLTYVRRKKPPKEVCLHCNGDINGYLFLECRTGNCPFCLCLHCRDVMIN